MGSITTGFSMSLDGFIAEPNDSCDRLFTWMFLGDTDFSAPMGGGELALKISAESAELLEGAVQAAGALIAGRRLFDLTHGWGGRHPLGVPIVVVSHRPAPEWVEPTWPVTFTESLDGAIEAAQRLAGEKSVAVASASVVQQCLNAGLMDEIHIDLVPIVLVKGIPLFANLTIEPAEMRITALTQAPGVTHITYQLVK